jgi:tetratricopeptide (TPR) repeat protein
MLRAQVDFGSIQQYRGLCAQGGCGNGGRAARSYHSNPSRAELERRRRSNAATDLNRQGIAADNARNWAAAASDYEAALKFDPSDKIIHENLAGSLDNLGVEAALRGDWPTAVNEFRAALSHDPDRPIIRDNLAQAEAHVREQQAGAASSVRIAAAIDRYSRVLAGGARPPAAPNLEFGDPNACPSSGSTMVVDACRVPSGLPRSVEDQIPDTPAGKRVKKGFEAVQGHDWKVARAWFEDALNHDPDNAGIARLVDWAKWMENPPEPLTPPPRPLPSSSGQMNGLPAGSTAMAGPPDYPDGPFNTDANLNFEANVLWPIESWENYAKAHPDYLQVHPELTPQAKPLPTRWQVFTDLMFGSRVPRNQRPSGVAGVRD